MFNYQQLASKAYAN